MHELFDICVDVLYWIANLFDITYKEANIWLFVIIEPILFVIMLVIIIWQRGRIYELQNRSKETSSD
jgi:hypothetical protein